MSDGLLDFLYSHIGLSLGIEGLEDCPIRACHRLNKQSYTIFALEDLILANDDLLYCLLFV